MDFKEVISDRYSCKNFQTDTVILDSQLTEILEGGRVAPTAKNLQEQHIYVLQGDYLKIIDEVTPCRYGATTCLVVAFDKNNVFTYPGGKRNSGIEDATIVATHLMLAAKNAGVDSCWVNFFDPDELHRRLQLPENEEILMILDLGFANQSDKPLANHFSRKKLSETVTSLK